MQSLSIIIINYNTCQHLKILLDSLTENMPCNIPADIWVVDNASKDTSVEMIKRDFPEVGLINNRKNLGYAKAANQGIRLSTGKYIVISNADVQVLDNALEKMVIFLENHPEIGILGPKVYDDSQKKGIQPSCRSFPSFQTALFNRNSLLNKLFPRNRWSNRYLMLDWDHRETKEVDWVSGCFLIIRREAIQTVGLLDEDFFMYNEDVDWCYRMKKSGWKVFYYPEAEVVHQIGASQINLKAIRERHKGMYYFYTKHYARNPLVNVIVKWSILMRMAISLLLK